MRLNDTKLTRVLRALADPTRRLCANGWEACAAPRKLNRRHEFPRAAYSIRLSTHRALDDRRMQQVFQPDSPKHLRADTIGDAVDDFRPILGRIHMDAEGTLAEGRIDHIHNGRGDRARVGGCRVQAREPLYP